MKNDHISGYISKCMKCQQVKVEHQHPTGLLQPLEVPEWKWEVISMDFITAFPMNMRQHDSIMVVVDTLKKETHFIPVKSSYKDDAIAKIFMKEIFRLYGLPKELTFDKDTKFTSNFWKVLFAYLGTKLNFSTAYHPKTNGKIERVNQVLEYMLRMYVMDKPSKWEDYLHLVYFAYNNGKQASQGMFPYEDLYGRRCRTPMTWDNPVKRFVLGP